MKQFLCGTIAWASACLCLFAQVPDSPSPPPASSPRSGSAPSVPSSPVTGGEGQPTPSMFGRDLPFFNPGSEIITWDGQHWNINNQRIFQARFEKYLNAPEETSEEDRQYQTILRSMMQKLAPESYVSASLVQAWGLLPQGSTFLIDAHLCDSLADAVYTVWVERHEQVRLDQANDELRRTIIMENAKAEAKSGMSGGLHRSAKDVNGLAQDKTAQGYGMAPHLLQLAEANARLAGHRSEEHTS